MELPAHQARRQGGAINPNAHTEQLNRLGQEVSALELAHIQAIRAKAIAEIAATALEGTYKDQVLRGAVALTRGEAKEETNKDIVFFEDFLKTKGGPRALKEP